MKRHDSNSSPFTLAMPAGLLVGVGKRSSELRSKFVRTISRLRETAETRGNRVFRPSLVLFALLIPGCGSHLPLYDLEGEKIDPLGKSQAVASVFLFTRTDCPISNRYAPVVRRLHEEFAPQGIQFWLVYPDPEQAPDEIHRHLKEYDYPCRALRDPQHALVERTQVKVTPEAAVLLPNGHVAYRGRIDNRYADFGNSRPEATEHDLEDALTAILSGQPIENKTTKAVGCYISDLRTAEK